MSDKENWWSSATMFPKARPPNGALQLLSSCPEPLLRPALPEKAACPAANPDRAPRTNEAGVMAHHPSRDRWERGQNRSLSVATLKETPRYGPPRPFCLLINKF